MTPNRTHTVRLGLVLIQLVPFEIHADWILNGTIFLKIYFYMWSIQKWSQKICLAQNWEFNRFLGVQTWQVIFANFFLLTTACIGGICIRYPGEIGQRKAFMETRKCIETRIKITKVNILISEKNLGWKLGWSEILGWGEHWVEVKFQPLKFST